MRNSAIILNLVPVQSGGGLQNALSFLDQLESSQFLSASLIVICRANSELHAFCSQKSINCIPVPYSFLSRFFLDILGFSLLAYLLNARAILTLFGNSPLVLGNIRTISGFAYSNLLCPEINFWEYLPAHMRILKQVKDKIRLALTLLSAEIIFETPYLLEKARASFLFRGKKLHVVEMEPSSLVSSRIGASSALISHSYSDSFVLLCISGPHPNKRIHLLPEILKELVTMHQLGQFPRPSLVLTFSTSGNYAAAIYYKLLEMSLIEYVSFLGPVKPASVAHLLRKACCVVNVARLESFSNNWVEAWAAMIPLISTDADWARASCGDAALYIDPADAVASARAISRLSSDLSLRKKLIVSGTKRLEELAKHPKILRYEAILKNAIN